jgi:hypothetical protein
MSPRCSTRGRRLVRVGADSGAWRAEPLPRRCRIDDLQSARATRTLRPRIASAVPGRLTPVAQHFNRRSHPVLRVSPCVRAPPLMRTSASVVGIGRQRRRAAGCGNAFWPQAFQRWTTPVRNGSGTIPLDPGSVGSTVLTGRRGGCVLGHPDRLDTDCRAGGRRPVCLGTHCRAPFVVAGGSPCPVATSRRELR